MIRRRLLGVLGAVTVAASLGAQARASGAEAPSGPSACCAKECTGGCCCEKDCNDCCPGCGKCEETPAREADFRG